MMGKPSGFIVLHRQLIEWEWYKRSSIKDVFIHLLLTANFTDGKFEGRIIKRGQLATSLPSLSSSLGLSVQQVRTALRHLSTTGEITDEASHGYRVITVSKYDEYQGLTGELTVKQQSTNSQTTGNQQATNRQLTGNQQQYNNDNNDNNGNNGTMEQYTGETPDVVKDGFDLFWEAYPKKVAKQEAIKAWKSLKPDGLLLGKIINGIERWKTSDQWQRENGQYIPYPASWLRGKRWEDSVQPASKRQTIERSEYNPRSAHNFEERDYTGQEWVTSSDLEAEIEQARREGII